MVQSYRVTLQNLIGKELFYLYFRTFGPCVYYGQYFPFVYFTSLFIVRVHAIKKTSILVDHLV
jgi:hypothetical protein